MAWDAKDPDEVLDYSVDFRPRIIVGDSISAVQWFVPAGLTAGIQSFADGIASIFLSGGTENETYQVRCRVTTAQGRVMEQTARLRIRSR